MHVRVRKCRGKYTEYRSECPNTVDFCTRKLYFSAKVTSLLVECLVLDPARHLLPVLLYKVMAIGHDQIRVRLMI